MTESFGKRAVQDEAAGQAAPSDEGREAAAALSPLPDADAIAHGFFRGMEKADGTREKAIIAAQSVRDTCRWLAEELRRSFAAIPEMNDFSVIGKEGCVYVMYRGAAIIRAVASRTKLDTQRNFLPCWLQFDDYRLEHTVRLLDPRGEGGWNDIFHAIGEYCALKKAGVTFLPMPIEIKDYV